MKPLNLGLAKNLSSSWTITIIGELLASYGTFCVIYDAVQKAGGVFCPTQLMYQRNIDNIVVGLITMVVGFSVSSIEDRVRKIEKNLGNDDS